MPRTDCLSRNIQFAHASSTWLDHRCKPLLLIGTLARIELVNPHSTIFVYAKKPGGKAGEYDLWAFESAAPGLMARYGFKKDSVKPGEKIAVQYYALRSGALGGQLIRVFRTDGTELVADPHALGVQRILDKGRPGSRRASTPAQPPSCC